MFSSYLRQWSWGSERLSNFFMVTWCVIIGGTRIWCWSSLNMFSEPLWSLDKYLFSLFGCCSLTCGILVSRPGTEPVLLAVEAQVLTTKLSGKPSRDRFLTTNVRTARLLSKRFPSYSWSTLWQALYFGFYYNKCFVHRRSSINVSRINLIFKFRLKDYILIMC